MKTALAFAFALLLVGTAGAETFTVPDDLVVAGDISANGGLTVAGNSNTSGTASFSDFSCSHILQRYALIWNEGAEQGRAWPDTVVRVNDFPIYVALETCEIENVVCYLHTSGAGYDSITIDIKIDGVSIFSDLGHRPLFLATAANGGNTHAGGTGIRKCEISAGAKAATSGELITGSVRTYGTAGTVPTGLKVWLNYEPQY